MNIVEIKNIIKALDIKTMRIDKEYSDYRENSYLSIKTKKPLKVFVESIHGFMSLIIDEFSFDPLNKLICMYLDDMDVYTAEIQTIKDITFKKIEE